MDRRSFVSNSLAGLASVHAAGAFAEALTPTPRQTEGPFYPDHLPLDTDNDLLVVNDSLSPAVGEITWLSGRILSASGAPVRNATVEIWQCDSHGVYLHSRGGSREKIDKHFQGFGRFVTGSTGEYLFRTIKPVPYPGRTPHIHFAIKSKGQEKWTTQCYVRGDNRNDADGVLRGIKDVKARDSVLVPFQALPDSRTGELTARFDIVLGFTPVV